MEGRGLAKGIRASKTRPGLRAGSTRPVRWNGYDKRHRDKDAKFTALLHHSYHIDTLRFGLLPVEEARCGRCRRRDVRHYGEALEENLQSLSID